MAQFSGYTLTVLFTWLLKLTFFLKDGVAYVRMTCSCGHVIKTPISGEKDLFSEIEFAHKHPVDGFFEKGKPVPDGQLIAKHVGNVAPVCQTCHINMDAKSRSAAAVSQRKLQNVVWDMMAEKNVVDGKE